jgi:hypothetical protein
MLNMPEDECLKRIGDRRVDPYTGKTYNLKLLKLNNKVLVDGLKQALDMNGEQKQAKLDEIGLGSIAQSTLETLALDIQDGEGVDLQVLNRLT